ncbi:9085_t:CDS:2, partial [Rhizophagus irregularis]
ARNYTVDEMCFSVVMDIRSFGGNIKISTVKTFYSGVSGSPDYLKKAFFAIMADQDQDRCRNLNPYPTTFNLLNEAVNNNDNLKKDYDARKFMRIDENTIKAI